MGSGSANAELNARRARRARRSSPRPSAVNSVSAKAVGHMSPSSRFAWSLKPSVAYLDLNFCALWKKQTTLPSLAYAGIPYQVLGARAGALAVTMAWSRSAIARSGSGISAIFASTSLSPSCRARAAAFGSRARSRIAARSSAVNPFFAGFLSAMAAHLRCRRSVRRASEVGGAPPGRRAGRRSIGSRCTWWAR